MATSLTSPGLVLGSSKALMEAQRAIAFAKLFSTDFSSEMQGLGKTLSVPVFSGDATSYNDASNDFETTDGSIIPVQVTLDTLVKVTYKLGMTDLLEIDKSATTRNCGIAGGRAIAAVNEVINALDDLTLTADELASVSACFATCVEAWKSPDDETCKDCTEK